jgi:hypothetical protein
MITSILTALGTPIGALILAMSVGVLLAPLDLRAQRAAARSQCPDGPTPAAAHCGGPTHS